jgi:hypothetical protein
MGSNILYSTFVVISSISPELLRNLQMAPISRFGSLGPVMELAAYPNCEDTPTAANKDRNTKAFVSWKKTAYLQRFDIVYGGNGKSVDFPKEVCHWSRACSLQVNMRGIQWHPRVQDSV